MQEREEERVEENNGDEDVDRDHVSQYVERVVLEVVEALIESLGRCLAEVYVFNPVSEEVKSDDGDEDLILLSDVRWHVLLDQR